MAHVHGTGSMAAAGKALEHGMQGMTHETMREGMGGMVNHGIARAAMAGAAASVGSHTRRSLMNWMFEHPWVVFGLGVAAGYTIHKYRRKIIDAANRAAEKGKDFVLQQRENLEDIVAENRERED